MKKILLIIMALMLIGVTSCESNSKGETQPDNTPSIEPGSVDDTLSCYPENIYIKETLYNQNSQPSSFSDAYTYTYSNTSNGYALYIMDE